MADGCLETQKGKGFLVLGCLIMVLIVVFFFLFPFFLLGRVVFR